MNCFRKTLGGISQRLDYVVDAVDEVVAVASEFVVIGVAQPSSRSGNNLAVRDSGSPMYKITQPLNKRKTGVKSFN